MTFFFTLFVIMFFGFALNRLAKLVRIPALVFYLLFGMLLCFVDSKVSSPSFCILDDGLMGISSYIKKIALIIILLKAGLSLDMKDLRKVGRPAILMSFLPATVEMVAVGLLAPLFFNLSYTESFLLGSVLGAVSPAVVIPMMSKLLEEKYGFVAQELEYGPGFPVNYFQSDELDEAELLAGFSELLHDMTHHPKITLELGRSIAASCGTYYTHIVDLKRNQEQNYALVDGGMHHLVYFGQHMAMKQPFFHVCGKEHLPATDQWNLCGSLCSMNDVMTKQSLLPDLALGDVLAFENAGAYCMTEGISLFLSRDIPAVYLLLENGTAVQVRKAFDTATLNQPNYGKDV